MGSNNKKPSVDPNARYGSGSDPKGQIQNQGAHQQERYENQQGPMVNAFAQNYGRGSEANYGDYTDIMNQYRSIASGGGTAGEAGGGGGGGGGGGYSAFTVNPERVSAERASVGRLGPLERVKASDPFESYKGYQEFGQTGGYSPQDISNMRARGMAPIRAAYSNAERNVGQQRSLQGGYSPNAVAAQVKMAREQGQGMADAATNVEAGIAQARNQGRLAGYGGMAGIEGQRLGAQMQGDIYNAGQAFEGQKFDIGNERDVNMFNAGQGNEMGQFNANLNYQGQTYNADAQARAQAANNAAGQASADRAAASAAASNTDRLRALGGMTQLYGTSPGMSETFGNQLLQGVGQGGTFGLNLMGRQAEGQQLPGAWDQGMNRFNNVMDIANTAAGVGNAFLNQNQQRRPQPYNGPAYPSGPAYGSGGYQTPVQGVGAGNWWDEG